MGYTILGKVETLEELERKKKMNKELNEKYLSQMKTLNHQSDHDIADDILCDLLEELGYKELVEVYKKLPKWYS